MELRDVLITVSNKEVPNLTYMARSYPDDDYDDNGMIELYQVPVYYVYIEGTNDNNILEKRTWKALRFMPYWNPYNAHSKYKTQGWINAGIQYFPKSAIKEYKPNYRISNRPGFHNGAIVIRDSFYIHEGPEDINTSGFGSAGCVEVIGSFTRFKEDIKDLSGSDLNSDSTLLKLVEKRKFYLEVEKATPPDIFKSRIGEYDPISKRII